MKILLPLSFALTCVSCLSASLPRPDSILITQGNVLLEHSPQGAFIQSFGTVPHPDTLRYDITDVVTDSRGLIHVLNLAPFDNRYISTLDPSSGVWTHTLEPNTFFGNVSDGDLSVRGETLLTKRTVFTLPDVSNQALADFSIESRGELTFGLDGLIYALGSGSPRASVDIYNPSDFSLIRSLTLVDENGFRISARGIAVTEAGQIFVAEWEGELLEYTADGVLVKSSDTGANGLTDLDLNAAGDLIVGSRFGTVVFTDTDLETFTEVSVGTDFTYAGFVDPSVPEPAVTTLVAALAIGMCGLIRRRRRRAFRHWSAHS